MKVVYEHVPLGNGTVGFSLAPEGWTFTTAPNEATASTLTLKGDNPYDLRRLLLRFVAALDVAGLADLEPSEES